MYYILNIGSYTCTLVYNFLVMWLSSRYCNYGNSIPHTYYITYRMLTRSIISCHPHARDNISAIDCKRIL